MLPLGSRMDTNIQLSYSLYRIYVYDTEYFETGNFWNHYVWSTNFTIRQWFYRGPFGCIVLVADILVKQSLCKEYSIVLVLNIVQYIYKEQNKCTE